MPKGPELKNYLRAWEMVIPYDPILSKDTHRLFSTTFTKINQKIAEEVKDLGGVNFNLALVVVLSKLKPESSNDGKKYIVVLLRSAPICVLPDEQIDDYLNTVIADIQSRLEKFTNEGSGWEVERNVSLALEIAKYKPFKRRKKPKLRKQLNRN